MGPRLRHVSDARDQARQDYIDRPSIDRDTRIQQYQDADTNPERREMREALANIYPQSSAADIEHQLWHDWAWEDAPPPPSAGRISAAAGPNAVPLFSESLDPMEKLGWETGEEYLERVEAVQAMRDQLSRERAGAGEPRGTAIPRGKRRRLQGPAGCHAAGDAGGSPVRLGLRTGTAERPGSGPGRVRRRSGAPVPRPWFHGIAYEQERDWLAGKAGFYRSVGHAIAIGQTGTGEDLDAAIDTLKRLSAQPAITTQQLEYLDQVINSHERARETVTAAGESAIEAWEGKVLGNINAFGDPETKARARAVLDDGGSEAGRTLGSPGQDRGSGNRGDSAPREPRRLGERKVLSNINTFGDPDAKAQARGGTWTTAL